jgi:transcriptional regulator with XRE-family HTH domain
MPQNTRDTPRSRALGAELRRLRENRAPGVSLRKFAQKVGVSPTALSHWENGRKPPTSEQVAVLLGALGVVGPEQERLLEDARAALDPTWVEPGVNRQLSALRDFEETATAITDVSPLLIPGLLQTEDYARQVMSNLPVDQLRRSLDARMTRQRILTRAQQPVRLVALIGQPALTRPIGGPTVFIEQLRHLQKMVRLDNVDIRALSTGPDYEPSLLGAFVLYEFDLAGPIVHFEHHRSSMFLPDKRDVEDMRVAAEKIKEKAMSPTSTQELIADVINRTE